MKEGAGEKAPMSQHPPGGNTTPWAPARGHVPGISTLQFFFLGSLSVAALARLFLQNPHQGSATVPGTNDVG